MSVSKLIQSVVIVACSVVFTSQVQAVPLKGPQTSTPPKTGPSFGGVRKKTIDCKRAFGSGFVSSNSQSMAIYGAKQIWKRKTARKYGNAYSFWGFSRNQRSSCKDDRGKYLCKVTARPCNGGNIMKR